MQLLKENDRRALSDLGGAPPRRLPEAWSARQFDARREKILRHHTAGEFAYPGLNTNESQAIRVIAMTLYKNIQAEVDRCHSLYEELDRVFVANLDGDGGPEPGNRGERGAP